MQPTHAHTHTHALTCTPPTHTLTTPMLTLYYFTDCRLDFFILLYYRFYLQTTDLQITVSLRLSEIIKDWTILRIIGRSPLLPEETGAILL